MILLLFLLELEPSQTGLEPSLLGSDAAVCPAPTSLELAPHYYQLCIFQTSDIGCIHSSIFLGVRNGSRSCWLIILRRQ